MHHSVLSRGRVTNNPSQNGRAEEMNEISSRPHHIACKPEVRENTSGLAVQIQSSLHPGTAWIAPAICRPVTTQGSNTATGDSKSETDTCPDLRTEFEISTVLMSP